MPDAGNAQVGDRLCAPMLLYAQNKRDNCGLPWWLLKHTLIAHVHKVCCVFWTNGLEEKSLRAETRPVQSRKTVNRKHGS